MISFLLYDVFLLSSLLKGLGTGRGGKGILSLYFVKDGDSDKGGEWMFYLGDEGRGGEGNHGRE